ncbi:hypothetical protein [Rhizobium rhizogenes]|uniref:hypothetical protein n=1 Tax=Rhizobium rhizogenes TaxID=359 RepID=UPI0013763A42|nr:hypothetical protein [Rhizobium rhizogenes]NTI85116.1 hypothetical protein [Rhizobium rhizogenes]NTJ27450.1 hypothetical protein [Rhizobium rhizogenes]QUE84908.1 hypothetical protein EML492_33640 [Rhizobium rhizogenes]
MTAKSKGEIQRLAGSLPVAWNTDQGYDTKKRDQEREGAALEGRLGVYGAELLGERHSQLSLGKVELNLDLTAFRVIARVSQLGPQFFDVLFDRHGLISLSS